MSKAIRKGVKLMALTSKGPEKTTWVEVSDFVDCAIFNPIRRPRPAYENERWLYGYHFKTRHVRKLAEKCGLPWEEDPASCMFNVQHVIIQICDDLNFGWKYINYRGDAATIISFVEDDGRKRLEKNKFSEKDMKRVRRALGLPRGTKPKWYNRADRYDDDAEFSSDDEPFPEVDLFGRESTDEDILWKGGDYEGDAMFSFEVPDSTDDSSEESDEDMEENIVGNDQA